MSTMEVEDIVVAVRYEESIRWFRCETNGAAFLARLADYEVEPDTLAMELARRYQTARSWWDVSDIFPVMFIG